MKKLLLTILIAILALTTLAPLCVSADSVSESDLYFMPHGVDGYLLQTLEDNGELYGVRFQQRYFGRSGIAVTIELYTQTGLDLNFYVGSTSLTANQLATRNKVVEIFDWVDECVTHVDNVANTQYDGQNGLPLSDIYRYNSMPNGEEIQIDADTYQMLNIAREMYEVTNHAFNPATYRLVDLWGFSSRVYNNAYFTPFFPYDRTYVDGNFPLPEQKYIDAFSNAEFTSFSNQAVTLTQRDGNYYLAKNVAPAVVDGVEYQQWLDLGGVAKGYVADKVKQRFTALGYNLFYVDAGMSSQSFGKFANDETFYMEVSNPFDELASVLPQSVLAFDVQNASASTSGQYVRRYVTNGVEYAHIIDGQKGAPAQTGVKSIAIVVPDDDGANFWSCKADCLSTAMTVLGREGIVNFCNSDFFKTNGVEILVMYQTVDGAQQILSNIDRERIAPLSTDLQNFSWNLTQTNGVWFYDGNAELIQLPQTDYTWLLIVLGAVIVLAFVLVVVFHFVRKRQKVAQNIKNAKRDKFFKIGDVMVYLAVVLVVAVLFGVFFGADSNLYNDIQTIKVVDLKTNQVLFVYDVLRNEYVVNDEGSWKVTVTPTDTGYVVRFDGQIDGEQRFDEMTITRGAQTKVKMTNSICGFHQDCVRNFAELTKAGQTIVCSPNYVKIITE